MRGEGVEGEWALFNSGMKRILITIRRRVCELFHPPYQQRPLFQLLVACDGEGRF